MEEKILAIMREVFEDNSLDFNCSQENCENWDSLRHLNLIMELEEAFHVDFAPEEIARMKTYAMVKNVIEKKLPA